MNILKGFRNNGGTNSGDSHEAGSAEAGQALTDRYERLNERQAVAGLAQLSQIDLTAIETFERSHRERPAVLNKLRYLRQPEPLEGYDALELDAIGEALSGVDTRTLKAVREYERKLQRRPTALEEIARALHRASEPAVAGDDSGSPAPDVEQPLVVGNGLPTKVRPASTPEA